MVNYNKSIIYKICCKDINIKEIYVGSTANELRKRKYSHKYDCNNINSKNYNLYVYQFVRSNGGFENFDMVLIEEYNCNDKQELHKRERFYIELLEANLNSRIPNRNKKENREDKKDKSKEWREDNKDKIKEYYQSNKELILEKQKEYYKKNKELILEKNNEKKREKITCDICNKIMNRNSLSTHKKRIHK